MTDISPTYHHLDTWSGYNPLKFVDPTGERQMGWSPSTYYYEQMARLVVLKEQYRVYEVAMASHWLLMDYISNCVFSQGPNAMGCGGSGNHGSGIGGGGGQDESHINRPLVFITNYITDNDLPLYNFVIYNTCESSDNSSYFSELKKLMAENTKYFFIDGAAALEFMYENSFDENMNPYKEISAWVVDEGIIVQPWNANKEATSENYYFQFNDGNYYYEFQDNMYLIHAEIHTHPNYNNGDIGVSLEDLNLNNKIPVYIIYNSSLYNVGNPTIRLDQTRNINYYNWKKYFQY